MIVDDDRADFVDIDALGRFIDLLEAPLERIATKVTEAQAQETRGTLKGW